MSLVCFVSSLVKYVQTVIQILGQTSGLVKPAGSFTVWQHKISFLLPVAITVSGFMKCQELSPKKKGEGKTCWNVPWRLLVNLLFLWIHFFQRGGIYLSNLKPLRMILAVTLYLYLIWNFIKQLYWNMIHFVHWWMSVSLINIKKNCFMITA